MASALGAMQTSFLGGASLRGRGPAPFSAAGRRGAVAVRAGYNNMVKLGGGKKWERQELTANGKPVRIDMHVKKGDVVQVIAGEDKGTVGEVEKVLTKRGLVVIKGVNIKVRNVKPRNKDEQGQQKRMESPIHHSNVMHYSQAKGVRSRVAYKVQPDGSKVRFLVKTGEEVPDRSFSKGGGDAPPAAPAADAPAAPQQ
ncbi:MAG: plastid ribosomal protein L24 [Monoraphidium minutum]|nr:MAG: plastid ribosomal protein L24 [Monoraphidium minutum]